MVQEMMMVELQTLMTLMTSMATQGTQTLALQRCVPTLTVRTLAVMTVTRRRAMVRKVVCDHHTVKQLT